MRRQYDWDISCDELCARYNTDLPPYDPFFKFKYNPDVAYDPIYRNLNDFRHQQYIMERESKRKSTDSSASLASSVPDDLVIATPDDSPQIKRAKKPEAPKRDTVGLLAERMKTFVQEFAKSHEDLKAAHEEIRMIVKETEKTNENMFMKLTEFEAKILTNEKRFSMLEQSIADARVDIMQLRNKCVYKAAPLPTRPLTTTTPAIAKTSGSVVKPPAKSVAAANSPPGASSSKKASQELLEVDWDDEYCAKCNTDYKATEKHICKA